MRGPLLVCVGLGLLAAGCGKKPPPEPVTLKGHLLKADGTPAPPMVLTLQPQEDVNKSSMPSVATKEDGSFEVRCLPGRYKVTAAPIPRKGHGNPGPGGAEGPGAGTTPGAPSKASAPRSWEVEVPADGKSDLELKLPAQ